MGTLTFVTSASQTSPRSSPLLLVMTLFLWVGMCIPADCLLQTSLTRPHNPLGIGGVVLVIVSLHLMWLIATHIVASALLAHCRKSTPALDCQSSTIAADGPTAILLCTRDDWLAGAAESCLAAMRPGDQLLICDDSESPGFRKQVAEFARRSPARVHVVRRENLAAFKAGNLNHCLRQLDDRFAYVLIVDHDNSIEPDTIQRALCLLAQHPDAPFVQFAQRADEQPETQFAEEMQISVRAVWQSLSLRARYGLPLCVGHTVLFRRRVLDGMGGFPESATEDIGITLRLLARGLTGCYELASPGTESIPHTYQAFRARYARWCVGTLQCWGRELPGLVRKCWHRHELYDGLLQCAVLLYPVPLALLWVGMAALTADSGSAFVPQDKAIVFLALLGLLGPSLPLVLSSSGPKKAITNVMVHAAVYMSMVVAVNVSLASWLMTRNVDFTNTGNRFRTHRLTTPATRRDMWSANGVGTMFCELAVGAGLAGHVGHLGCLGGSVLAGVVCGIVWQVLPWNSLVSRVAAALPLLLMLAAGAHGLV